MRVKRLARYVRNRRSNWKGIAAGVAGGLAGAWTMNQFQSVWSKAAEKLNQNEDGAQNGNHQENRAQSDPEMEEDVTMKTAGYISKTIFRKPISHEAKKKAGPVVHYAFGALMGGAYGAAVENVPQTKAGMGIPFGATLFAAADEIAVPAFGLAKSFGEYPLSAHVSALAAHLVYGMTTEAVRKGVRQGLRFV